MEPFDISKRLEIVGRLKPGEKLFLTNPDFPYVAPNGVGVQRWLMGESREGTLKFLSELVDECEAAAGGGTLDFDLLSKSLEGICALRDTYRGDVATTLKLVIIQQRISKLVSGLRHAPGPELEPEPILGPESGPEPEPESGPGPEPEPEPESVFEPGTEPEPEPGPEPEQARKLTRRGGRRRKASKIRRLMDRIGKVETEVEVEARPSVRSPLAFPSFSNSDQGCLF
jgi:hypothetical protein